MMALIATLRTTAVHFVKGSYSGFCTDPLYTGCLAGPDCRDDLTVEQSRGGDPGHFIHLSSGEHRQRALVSEIFINERLLGHGMQTISKCEIFMNQRERYLYPTS